AHTEEEQCSTWLYLWFCSLRVCGAALRSTAWPIEGRHDERRAHAACPAIDGTAHGDGAMVQHRTGFRFPGPSRRIRRHLRARLRNRRRRSPHSRGRTARQLHRLPYRDRQPGARRPGRLSSTNRVRRTGKSGRIRHKLALSFAGGL
ncbi:LOW QUALITY PROTEIN: cold shock protein, partial [Rhodococcus opacus PD630]